MKTTTLVGDIRVDSVLDGTATFSARDILLRPDAEGDSWELHRALLDADGNIELPVGGFLLRTADRVILVDAGIGPIRRGPFQGGALLNNLAAVGVRPEDVTDVVLTHLHDDHVGWTTNRGLVVFPQATYCCHEADWDHFVGGPHPEPGSVRKLTPIADQLQPFGDGQTLAPGTDARLAPGHTPGSTIVVISSGDQRAMLLGDVAHCPFELTENDWEAVFDVDRDLAARTREALARELEGNGVAVVAAHFPGMQFGRLLPASGRRKWVVQ